MLKVSSKVSRVDAKVAELTAKRELSETKYSDGIAQKFTRGELAFAATSMHDNEGDTGIRGRIARACLIGGVGTYTYAAIAKAADCDVSEITRTRLRYIRHNAEFRADLVGYAFELDFAAREVRVRLATSEEKASSLRLARSYGLGKVSGYVPAPAKGKAAPAPSKGRAKGKAAPAPAPAPTGEGEAA